MTRIVILGAGIGGVPLAFELKDLLGKKAEITVVSTTDYFQFVPSNPWVAVRWRKPSDIKVKLADVFARRKIAFTSVGAKRVRPAENAVELNDGSTLEYDYLVVATGPISPSTKSRASAQRPYKIRLPCRSRRPHRRRLGGVLQNPGPMVIGAVQGASCFGPAYEYALTVVSDLRKRRIRDRVPITFVTSEPYIGHLGLGGVGDTKGMLESVMRDRDIKWVTNAKVDRVTADEVVATELNDDGTVKKTHTIPTKFTMMLPAFRGVDCLRDESGAWIEGLTNPRGFVTVDRKQRNAKYPNIFAVGVCVRCRPSRRRRCRSACPRPLYDRIHVHRRRAQHPRSRRRQGADARRHLERGVPRRFRRQWHRLRRPAADPARNVNWSSKGYWVHLAKVAYEIYFLRKVRKGQAEPVYERVIMKLLGIVRLRGKGA